MSEDMVPYRIYPEGQEIPLQIGKKYYYVEYVKGTEANNLKCKFKTKSVVWTTKVSASELKYMKKLFKTKPEAKQLADQRNKEHAKMLYENNRELSLEHKEMSNGNFLTSNKWIWEQMGGNYLEWQEEMIATQLKTNSQTPEAMDQLEIATNRIILANPDKMIPYLRKQGFNPQQMTMEEQRKVIGDMINEEIEALNSTDLN